VLWRKVQCVDFDQESFGFPILDKVRKAIPFPKSGEGWLGQSFPSYST